MHALPPNSIFVSQLNLSWLSKTYFVTSSHLSGLTQLLTSSQHHYQWDQCDPPPQHHTSRNVAKNSSRDTCYHLGKVGAVDGWVRKWLGEVVVKWKLEMMSGEMSYGLVNLSNQAKQVFPGFPHSPAVSAINISHFKNPSNPHPHRTARCLVSSLFLASPRNGGRTAGCLDLRGRPSWRKREGHNDIPSLKLT